MHINRTYTSIDPAPPSSGLLSGRPKPTGIAADDVKSLRATLLDTKVPLFERYRAMFALRNIGTPDAVDALASGFSDDSALFKCACASCRKTVLIHITYHQTRNRICFWTNVVRAFSARPNRGPEQY